jgi:hypothetical protein
MKELSITEALCISSKGWSTDSDKKLFDYASEILGKEVERLRDLDPIFLENSKAGDIISVKVYSVTYAVGSVTNRGTIKKIEFSEWSKQFTAGFEDGSNYLLVDLNFSDSVILTTEDGVNLFEGDFMTILNTNNLSIKDNIAVCKKPFAGNKEEFKYFSSEKAAKDYILRNLKGLSLADLLSVWSDVEGDYSNSPLFKNFENLAKSKL